VAFWRREVGNGTRQPLCGCSIDFKGKRTRRMPAKARAVALGRA
jgi:hypothetical protein